MWSVPSAEHAAGTAKRRREERVRQFLLTVAILLVEMNHHAAPRGQTQARAGRWVRGALHGDVPEEPTSQEPGTRFYEMDDDESVPELGGGRRAPLGEPRPQAGHERHCKSSRMHQNARLGLPQWCDQQFKKHGNCFFSWPCRHLFATLGKHMHFGFPSGGRTAGVAYPAATRQGNTKSKCNVAHTNSPT